MFFFYFGGNWPVLNGRFLSCCRSFLFFVRLKTTGRLFYLFFFKCKKKQPKLEVNCRHHTGGSQNLKILKKKRRRKKRRKRERRLGAVLSLGCFSFSLSLFVSLVLSDLTNRRIFSLGDARRLFCFVLLFELVLFLTGKGVSRFFFEIEILAKLNETGFKLAIKIRTRWRIGSEPFRNVPRLFEFRSWKYIESIWWLN